MTMKRILIMAAEQEELDAALAAYKPCEGLLQNAAKVDFMLCGIGMASACYTITKKICEAKAAKECYDIAILIGLAGSYCMKDFPIGSVALIEKAYIGDLGFDTPSGLKTLFDTKVLDSNIFPFKDGALYRKEADMATEEFLKRFRSASAVTRQTFTGSPAKKEEMVEKFSSQIEDMEGAALHFVCQMEKIPFFQLRAVSNEVGVQDRDKWNGPLALDALKRAMLEYFRMECKILKQ